MNRFRRLSVTVPFCVALITPVVVPLASATPAQERDHDQDHREHRRIYDAEHKDYHDWDATEERHWHEYWEHEHRPYRDWDRASDAQRRAYWRWRHEHEHDHDRR